MPTVESKALELKSDAFDVLSDMITKGESDEDLLCAVHELVYGVDACLDSITD
jgi:hypothetical protein